MTTSWIRTAAIAGGVGIIGLAIFTVFILTTAVTLRPANWAMAPDINFNDLVFGLKTAHPRPGFGEIVLYVAPDDPPALRVGRVAGTPGDTIVIDGGQLYRNDAPVPFFRYAQPRYQLQVAGAGILLGNAYIRGYWPPAERWSAANTIPEDCYLILGNFPDYLDSHVFGFVPGSRDGACASTQFPDAHIVGRVTNVWHLGPRLNLPTP